MSARPPTELVRAWDRLVEENGDVAQLSAWASVRRQAGFTPRFVLAERSGRVTGGALILLRRLPIVGVVGYLPYGPLIEPEDDVVVQAICDVLSRAELAALFVQPPVGSEDVSDELLRRGFRLSEAGISPAASIRLDLTRPGRRLKIGRGVTVRLGEAHDLPLVAELITHTAAHHRFTPLSLDYLQVLHRELGEHVKIFIADVDGTPAAASLYTGCGGTLTGRLTGMRRDERVRRADTGRAINSYAISWARDNGYRGFDLGGIPLDAVDMIRRREPGYHRQLSGPTQFKTSFGGEPYRYPPAVELISSRLLRAGYDTARALGAQRLVNLARRTMRGGKKE